MVLLAAGALAALLPPIAGLPLFGYLAIATAALRYVAADAAGSIAAVCANVPDPRSVPAALAFDQLRGAPGQASVSLVTIVASVSLMVSMAIMVASFRQSLDDWLTTHPACGPVRARGRARATARISAPTTSASSTDCPACAASTSCACKASSSIRRSHVSSCWRATFRRTIRRAHCRWSQMGPRGRQATARPMWVSEAIADLYGYRPGPADHVAARRACRRLHRRGRVARLRAAAGRHRDRALAICGADGRRHGQRSGARPRTGCARRWRAARTRGARGRRRRG